MNQRTPILNGHSLCNLAAGLAVLLLLSACQTTPIPPMRPGGKAVSGQVQVSTRKISLIGEFSARYNANEFECEVSKAAGMPLITVHTLGNDLARIEGGGRVWQGNPKWAPSFLKSWIELSDAFTGHVDPNTCVVLRTGRELKVEFPQRNEHFVFVLDTDRNVPRL